MGRQEKNLIKKALEYFYSFSEVYSHLFLFHDYRFISENMRLCKEIAKGEGLDKEDYELGLVALILSDIGLAKAADKKIDKISLINDFLKKNEVSDKDSQQIWYYIEFLETNKIPQTTVERVLRDGKDIYLGQPDALERLALLRIQEEKVNGKTYSDLEWLQVCKQYFLMHSFDTRYANRMYGPTRSKNYFELEKRIDKLRTEEQKGKKDNGVGILSDKESEDLFKIAFRNYLDLIALADRKAGLLIQVNSILAPVVFALVIRRIEVTPVYALPTATILIGAAITIFYGILASRPLEKSWDNENISNKEQFFFGSFDRLDPKFKNVSWEKYSSDMTNFFKGDKRFVFDELIKESYQVRQVLSKKFGYLSIAYKVFFAGLLLAIIGFLAVIIYEYTLPANHAGF